MNFSSNIIDWYHQNKRDLPWRKSNNPYFIWLSEIILQQTRVNQGLSYYIKFINRFPTIDLLANASENDILKLWQGLGYYSRARNLHETAKLISKNYNNVFPDKYEEIIKLKGIGEYTAAAISSFAFNLPYPVLDGNVFRVISRVFGVNLPIDTKDGKMEVKNILNKIFTKKASSDFNQAIMEFGALQCVPKNPNCNECIFKFNCYALKYNDKTYVVKRDKNDIWKGLYQFPIIETEKEIKSNIEFLNNLKNHIFFKNNIITINNRTSYKHILTHQKIIAIFWKITINNKPKEDKTLKEIEITNLNQLPVPKLVEKFISEKVIID